MAWIESHQSLGTHKKLLSLCDALKISDCLAVGILHFLWWWSLDNAPDGDISGIPPKTIAIACHWRGSPEKIYKALEGSGWLDHEGDKTILHDWWDYAGKLIAKRQQNTQRMKLARATNVQRTNIARAGATVPNSTVPSISKDIHSVVEVLPEWLNKELWDGFLEMRKKIKSPPTDRAKKMLLKELEDLPAGDRDKVLELSIKNNWKGLYPLKGDNNGVNTKPTLKESWDDIQRKRREARLQGTPANPQVNASPLPPVNP